MANKTTIRQKPTITTRTRTGDSNDARPRRTALSRDRIEVESLALIEEVGIDEFSTRKLGQRLGCEAMSIYHYFPSKAHIMDALADRLLAAMPTPDPGLSPAMRLRGFAQNWRTLAVERPRIFPWLSLHRRNSEIGTRMDDEIVACFYDAGLSPERASLGFRVLGYYVQGAALDEGSGYANGTSSLRPLPAAEVAAHFPRVATIARYSDQAHFDTMFELGFTALLREFGLE
ncbi:MAG: TetR/AcrR family transcriptional regulator [Burkholderiales bacterium]|nr:TetR/AcrR family transcriptional regulator [Burkholderiales bacterium]